MPIKVRENQPSAGVCESHTEKAMIDHYCEVLTAKVLENEARIDLLFGVLGCQMTEVRSEYSEDTKTDFSYLPEVFEMLIHRLVDGINRLTELEEGLRIQVGVTKILR